MSTPSQRVRARHDPAIATPPPSPTRTKRTVRNLTLQVAGRSYQIGEHIEGDTPWSFTIEGAAQITLPVRSPDASLLEVLADEAQLQEHGVRVVLDDDVYVLSSLEGDETGLYTLVFVDEVAWRLQQYSSFISAVRGKVTRAGFIRRFVDEASRPPLAPMRSFIPEIADRQPIAAARGIA